MLAAIAASCRRAGRDAATVTLVAVTKTLPTDCVGAAVAAGLTLLGENRVQELVAKAPLAPGATWHLVGHLQANKARDAVEVCAAIESVDSLELAGRLDRLVGEGLGAERRARPDRLPVYLEVNVDRDPAKAGFTPEGLAEALPALAALPRLELAGLMTVGRLVPVAEAARPTFAALRELSGRLQGREARLGGGLSMGMSHDYAVAVEEGATVVRIGRALFGERPGGGGPAAGHAAAGDDGP